MKKIAVVVLFLAVAIGLFFLKKNFNIQSKNNTATSVILSWEHSPEKITVETPVTFSLSLKDQHSNPIPNATLSIEANMNHSGMVPVYTEAAHTGGGLYKSSIKLTMPGEWILFVTIKLQNGEVINREITFSTN